MENKPQPYNPSTYTYNQSPSEEYDFNISVRNFFSTLFKRRTLHFFSLTILIGLFWGIDNQLLVLALLQTHILGIEDIAFVLWPIFLGLLIFFRLHKWNPLITGLIGILFCLSGFAGHYAFYIAQLVLGLGFPGTTLAMNSRESYMGLIDNFSYLFLKWLIPATIGGFVFGFVFGLIPFFLDIYKNQPVETNGELSETK